MAYIQRASLEIAERVRQAIAEVTDPRERLVEGILSAVREVRSNPATAAWFEPSVSGLAARMSRSSEVIESLMAGFVWEQIGDARDDPDSRLRASWLIRLTVSLLAMPGESEEEELAMIERFVAPALVDEES